VSACALQINCSPQDYNYFTRVKLGTVSMTRDCCGYAGPVHTHSDHNTYKQTVHTSCLLCIAYISYYYYRYRHRHYYCSLSIFFKQSKAIPVTGRGGLEGCEMLRIHIVYIIGSQMAVRLSVLMHRSRFAHQKHYFSAPDSHFCYRLSGLTTTLPSALSLSFTSNSGHLFTFRFN
jgi:hypothetical protein